LGQRENTELTKKELIEELNKQDIGDNEEILISSIRKSGLNNENAIPGLSSIDFVGSEFINITIGSFQEGDI